MDNKRRMKFYQRGQALIIVVMVLAVALPLALSGITRTITTLRTTAEEESSQRAFSAAEAGIERALHDNTDSSETLANNANYNVTIENLAGQEFLLNNGVLVLKDDAVDLWLSTYPDYTNAWSGTLTLYWGGPNENCEKDESTNTMAALEVVLIRGTKPAPQLTHYALDPCRDRAIGPSGNKFEDVSDSGGGTVEGKDFAYKRTISIDSANPGLLMRIIPLYASTTVAVKGCDGLGGNCNDLPSQGKQITSTGTSDNTERRIIGFQEYPKLPVQIFPYILFSPK